MFDKRSEKRYNKSIMKLSKQEQIIKEKMKSFQPDLDKDSLWESLEQYVPNNTLKRRKKRFVIILLFILVTTGVLVGALVNNSITEPIKQKHSAQTNFENKSLKRKKSNIDKVNNNLANNHDDNSKINNNNSISGNDKSTNISKRYTHSKKAIKNKSYNFNAKSKILAQNTRDIIDISNAKSGELNEAKSTVVKKSDRNTLRKIDLKVDGNLLDTKLRALPQLVAVISNPTVTIIELKKTSQADLLALNIEIGLGDFNHAFVPKSTNSEFLTKYFNTNTKPVWNIALGLHYNLTNTLYTGAGIEYTQLVTQLHPKWEQILNEQNPYYNKLTQRVVKQLEYEAIAHNYQNAFDMPIDIGIKLIKSKKLGLSIEAGAIFNLYTYSKGVVLDHRYKLHYYDDNSNNPYGKFELGWSASAVFDYQMYSNMNIYLKPSFITRSINYNFAKFDVKENYHIYNLKLGVNYKL